MSLIRSFFIALLFSVYGCRTLSSVENDRTSGARLTDEQFGFVKALAHYGTALVYKDSDPERGLHHTLHAITNDPDSVDLYVYAASLYLNNDNAGKATEILEKAVNANPDSSDAHASLGLVYLGTQQTDKAVKQYIKAIELAPEKTEIYQQLASIHLQRNEDKKALAVLEDSFNKSEKLSSIISYCYHVGLQYISINQRSRAIPFFELLARHDSKRRSGFHEVIGDLYVSMQKFNKAAEYFRKVAKAKPSDPDPVLKLASLYAVDSYKKAINLLESAPDIIAGHFDILYRLAQLYSADKQFDAAVIAFTEAQKNWPQEGDKDKNSPLPPVFYINYGAVYEQTGELEKAEEIFKKCIDLYPDSHEALNYLAYTWAENDINLDEALAYIQKALKMEPENGAYIDTLGWIYYKKGKYEEALTKIEKALERLGADPVLLDHIGDVHNKLGSVDKALEYWKRSFMLDTESDTVKRKLEERGADIQELIKQSEKQRVIDNNRKTEPENPE